jgi:hypothetical protein
VLKGGKTNKSGKPGYSGCIRSRDPELCPIRALAYHLMHRFTIENVPFPDPRYVCAILIHHTQEFYPDTPYIRVYIHIAVLSQLT